MIKAYDTQANHFYWSQQFYSNAANRDKTPMSSELCSMWIEWAAQLTRFEETPLGEFTAQLSSDQCEEFTTRISNLSDPLHMMSLDFDVMITSDQQTVIRYMEQTDEVLALDTHAPL